MLLLDTHVLDWLFNGNKKLGKTSRHMAEEAMRQGQLAVSAYAFWELAMLQAKNRLPWNAPLETWRKGIIEFGVSELPFTGNIGIAAWQLQNFHPDPADRIMVATALYHHVPLMTADRPILSWKGGLKCFDARR